MNPESLKLKNEECLGRETGERFLAPPDLTHGAGPAAGKALGRRLIATPCGRRSQAAGRWVGPYIGRRIDDTSSFIRLAGDRRMPPSPEREALPYLATFINLFLLGYVVEFSQSLCAQLFPALGLGGRALLLVSALVPLSLASSLYFTADLGVSTYDAVALVWSERQRRIPFPLCRILTDSACVLAGGALCLLSGMSLPQLFGSIGIAIVITAFFMGPLIEFFNKTVSRPLLGAKTEANGK